MIDRTPIGEQHVIPGAEHVGTGELAKRKAAASLRPRVPQKPMDCGLFSDDAAQLDLVTLCKR